MKTGREVAELASKKRGEKAEDGYTVAKRSTELHTKVFEKFRTVMECLPLSSSP